MSDSALSHPAAAAATSGAASAAASFTPAAAGAANADAAGALRGKVAFVTGAASGLGAALARRLAAAGAHVVVADLRADALEAGAAALRASGASGASGARVEAMALDVADPGGARAAVDATLQRLGRLDILVNNAGTDVTLPLADLSESDWLRVLGTNLHGPFLLAKYAAAAMGGNGNDGGDIVNVVSTAAKRAWPNACAYHASKWGLLGLSHALHAELRPQGIRVMAVVAGGMRTPFLLDRFPDLDPARLQEPDHVAQAIQHALLLPRTSVIPELTVLPMQETSWP